MVRRDTEGYQIVVVYPKGISFKDNSLCRAFSNLMSKRCLEFVVRQERSSGVRVVISENGGIKNNYPVGNLTGLTEHLDYLARRYPPKASS